MIADGRYGKRCIKQQAGTKDNVHKTCLNFQITLILHWYCFVFSQFSAAVVRHKTNDGVVYAIWAWFEYETHCLEWYKPVLCTRLFTRTVHHLVLVNLLYARNVTNCCCEWSWRFRTLPAPGWLARSDLRACRLFCRAAASATMKLFSNKLLTLKMDTKRRNWTKLNWSDTA